MFQLPAYSREHELAEKAILSHNEGVFEITLPSKNVTQEDIEKALCAWYRGPWLASLPKPFQDAYKNHLAGKIADPPYRISPYQLFPSVFDSSTGKVELGRQGIMFAQSYSMGEEHHDRVREIVEKEIEGIGYTWSCDLTHCMEYGTYGHLPGYVLIQAPEYFLQILGESLTHCERRPPNRFIQAYRRWWVEQGGKTEDVSFPDFMETALAEIISAKEASAA